MLYHSLNHPHLLFGLPLWGNANQSYLNRLQRLQNKALRIITDSKLRMSTNPKYYTLGILKLLEFFTLEIAKLMHQYSHHTFSQPFFSLFTPIPQYMSDLPEQKPKTNFTFQDFLQHFPKKLLNMKELNNGTQSQLELNYANFPQI